MWMVTLMPSTAEHWQQVYSSKSADEVSWFQREPEVSLRLIEKFSTPSSNVVDIGAGESLLIDQLISHGYSHLTVMDISSAALEDVKVRLGASSHSVNFEVADIRYWQPSQSFELWHDRAVFHFMNSDEDVGAYVRTAANAVRSNGFVVLGTFAEDGPLQCSGLDVRRYSAERLADVFSENFSLVETESEDHTTPWDATQHFTWVVLQRK